MNPDPFFWKGRSVLITGATGLLGGWLTPALIRKGANVVALVRELAPDRMLVRDGWLDRLTAICGCLGDDVLIRRTLAEYSVQTVFHLGGQTLVGVANADPVGTLEANVRGTYLLLEAARHTRVEQILIASSVKAYGTSGLQPHREDDPFAGPFPLRRFQSVHGFDRVDVCTQFRGAGSDCAVRKSLWWRRLELQSPHPWTDSGDA